MHATSPLLFYLSFKQPSGERGDRERERVRRTPPSLSIPTCDLSSFYPSILINYIAWLWHCGEKDQCYLLTLHQQLPKSQPESSTKTLPAVLILYKLMLIPRQTDLVRASQHPLTEAAPRVAVCLWSRPTRGRRQGICDGTMGDTLGVCFQTKMHCLGLCLNDCVV